MASLASMIYQDRHGFFYHSCFEEVITESTNPPKQLERLILLMSGWTVETVAEAIIATRYLRNKKIIKD